MASGVGNPYDGVFANIDPMDYRGGEYKIIKEATDIAGNVTTGALSTKKMDARVPGAGIEGLEQIQVSENKYRFNVTVWGADDSGEVASVGYKVYRNGEYVSGAQGPYSPDNPQPLLSQIYDAGYHYTIVPFATDLAGNMAEGPSIDFYLPLSIV